MTTDGGSILEGLASRDVARRLSAARSVARTPLAIESDALRKAARAEPDELVSRILQRAVKAAESQAGVPLIEEQVSAQVVDKARSRGLREATGMFLHEVRPLIGEVEVVASELLGDYAGGPLEAAINDVRAALSVFDDLMAAASVGESAQFDLTSAITSIARVEAARLGAFVVNDADVKYADERLDDTESAESPIVRVSFAREDPVMILGSERLLGFALANAIRNAIESCQSERARAAGQIVISWGQTDLDVWVTVVDNGPGLAPALGAPFNPGTTTKREGGPHGMGLVIVDAAIRSLNGTARLDDSDSGGCRFEVRWPTGAAES